MWSEDEIMRDPARCLREDATRRWTSARAEVREGKTRALVAAHDTAAIAGELALRGAE